MPSDVGDLSPHELVGTEIELALPCEDEPMALDARLVVPTKDDGEAAIHALAHGAHPPCVLLRRALELLDDPSMARAVWRVRPARLTAVGIVSGDALAKDLEAQQDLLVRADAVERVPRQLLHALMLVAPALPGPLLRLVLGRAALALEPEHWERQEAVLSKSSVSRLVNEAFTQAGIPYAVNVSPWEVASFDGHRIGVAPSWVSTVWARRASWIDGAATISLRSSPDGHVATRIWRDGEVRSTRVTYDGTRWRVTDR